MAAHDLPPCRANITLRFAVRWDPRIVADRLGSISRYLGEAIGFAPSAVMQLRASRAAATSEPVRDSLSHALRGVAADAESIDVAEFGREGRSFILGAARYGFGRGVTLGVELKLWAPEGDPSQWDVVPDPVAIFEGWPAEVWPLTDLAAAEVDLGWHRRGPRDARWMVGRGPVEARLLRTLVQRTVIPPAVDEKVDWAEVERVLPDGTDVGSWHGMRMLVFPECPWQLPAAQRDALFGPFRKAMAVEEDWVKLGLVEAPPWDPWGDGGGE